MYGILMELSDDEPDVYDEPDEPPVYDYWAGSGRFVPVEYDDGQNEQDPDHAINHLEAYVGIVLQSILKLTQYYKSRENLSPASQRSDCHERVEELRGDIMRMLSFLDLIAEGPHPDPEIKGSIPVGDRSRAFEDGIERNFSKFTAPDDVEYADAIRVLFHEMMDQLLLDDRDIDVVLDDALGTIENLAQWEPPDFFLE